MPAFNCVPAHSIDEEHDPKKNRHAIFTSDNYNE
jgi:hypothetical protein